MYLVSTLSLSLSHENQPDHDGETNTLLGHQHLVSVQAVVIKDYMTQCQGLAEWIM